MAMREFILMFVSDPRLMALLSAGSKKIKDGHREKVHVNECKSLAGILFIYCYLIYHHSCLNCY